MFAHRRGEEYSVAEAPRSVTRWRRGTKHDTTADRRRQRQRRRGPTVAGR